MIKRWFRSLRRLWTPRAGNAEAPAHKLPPIAAVLEQTRAKTTNDA
jgi:hypothetical protein